MGSFKRSAFVRANLKRSEPTWFLRQHVDRRFNPRRTFRLLRRCDYANCSQGEFNRMVNYPGMWWASQYWILNGGTDRLSQIRLRFSKAFRTNKTNKFVMLKWCKHIKDY